MLKLGSPAGAGSSAAAQQEIAALRAQIGQLTEELHAAYSGRISMQGYLLKHRPVTQLMGLFSQEWEMRYFVLSGTVLRYYKGERDAAVGARGVVDIQGCVVEPEEVGSRRQFRFRIMEPGGNLLLRLGADNKAAAESWLAALESVGLRVQLPGVPSASSSPRGGSYPDRRQQDRWEASSTDSELPESVGRAARHHHHQQQQQRGGPGMPVRPPSASSASAAAAAMAADVAAATSTKLGGQQQQQLVQRQRSGKGGGGEARRGSLTGAAAAALGGAGGAGAAAAAASGSGGSGTADGSAGGAAGAAAAATRPPMSGSTPVHTSTRYSYLSSDGIWAAKHDGLLNLCIIILVATNFRLILENLLKYGWRLNFISYVASSLAGRGNLALVLTFPALAALAVASLWVELLGQWCLRLEARLKAASSKKGNGRKSSGSAVQQLLLQQTDALLATLHALCCAAAIALPWAVIRETRADAVPGLILMLTSLTVFMKLVSYAHCHADLRACHRRDELTASERGAPGSSPEWAALRYPENLSLANMLYYMAVPTLTYQVNFPRSPRIRKRWLLRRIGELAVFTGLLLFIANQYLEPAVSNALRPLSESDWVRVAERVLKLALPSLYAWLCVFYCLFHLHLNIIGELTRFGDRQFYQDWWNASTIGDYWKLWNRPVHTWLLRTVYFPAMRAGFNRFSAMVLVFLVSALGHELAVGVPLHMMRGWSFWGIMAQVPLIYITEALKKRLKSDTWGNYCFWIFFAVIGQPVCLLMYVHDYFFQNIHAAA